MPLRGVFVAIVWCLTACGRTAKPSAPTNSEEKVGAFPAVPSAPLAAPSASATPSSLTEVREYVATSVKAGYLRREEIIQSAVEIYAEEVRHPDLASAVARMADEELSAQQRREGDWRKRRFTIAPTE